MRKIVFASSVVISLIAIGCGGSRGGGVVQEKVISIKSISMDNKTNTIVTTDTQSTLTFLSDAHSDVYVDNKYIGKTSSDGSLEVTFDGLKSGKNSYKVYSINDGIATKSITVTILKEQKSASMGNISTAGKANNLTASQNGVIFIAEKESGVEVVSIGFNDSVDTVLLSTIGSIDAQNVVLSEDEKKLFIQDRDKKFHVIDISDIKNPTEIEVVSKIESSLSIVSEDKTQRFHICSKGLVGEDISNPSHVERNFILKDKGIRDVILVDNDTKLLIAHATEGLKLISIEDAHNPVVIATKDLHANTTGLSLLKDDQILFVANGESGVEIFNLHILLAQMHE